MTAPLAAAARTASGVPSVALRRGVSGALPRDQSGAPVLRDQSGSPRAETSHYADLDFLRGVAALVVVLFHCSERAGLPALFPRGYLGVDLFFAMSGFVLAHAYGDRLGRRTLRFGRFAALRLVRLGPTIVLGTTVAALVELGRPSPSAARHLVDIAETWFAGCLVLPFFGHTTLEPIVFPLDGPVWSLFFEIAANAVFALALLRGVGRWALALALPSSAVLLGLYLLTHGTLADAGSIAVDFAAGVPRVGLGFSLGIVLYAARRRFGTRSIPRVLADRRLLAALFALVCLMPALPGGWNPLFDGLASFVILPLIVFAAGAETPHRRVDRIALWSGRVSYPLYAVHYPLVRVVGVLLRHHVADPSVRLALVSLFAVLMLAAAALIDTVYDRPVRARLLARLGRP